MSHIVGLKPIVIEIDGVYGQLPDGGILNAGGTSFSSWTVDGRGLLFDDGTSTAPGSGTANSITLQSVYNNSPTAAGATSIKLSTGKDFVISDDTDDGIYFKIDAETGKVTITGDLEVLGSSSVIDSIIQDSDHWLISPKLGTTSALKIEPDFGVIPVVDLVTIRRTFASLPVFRIDSSGNLIASQNLTIGGLINGVNIVSLKSEVDHHAAGDTGYRHYADDVDILPIPGLTGASNVQEALEQINNNVNSGGGGGGSVIGYEHVQSAPSTLWTITHNKNTFKLQTTIYNTNWEQLVPNNIQIIDNNTVLVSFNAPIAGRAMLLLF
jgi:hypothetical protein